MLAIVDYGVGNLFSLKSSFAALGVDAIVTRDAETLRAGDRIVLPGVGAFEDAARKLKDSGLADIVCEQARKGKPLLGICLGMQLLFEKSYEYGEHAGLGLIPGAVKPIAGVVDAAYKIPHIGWNALRIAAHPLWKHIQNGDFVYFVHSYYAADCDESIIATTEYGAQITAAVARGNIVGCQFHPEKSGAVGLNILRAFCEMEG